MTRSSAKKAFLAILTAVLSVAAILLVYLRCTSGEQAFFAAEPPQAAPTISELSPLDGFCPDGLGRCAWIELHNNTDEDFDLSGCSLTKSTEMASYTFPANTILPVGERLLIHCGENCGAACRAGFTISAVGREVISLLNADGKKLDSVNTVACAEGSLVRTAKGLELSSTPTPGYSNDESGFALYTEKISAGLGELRISELLAKNHSVLQCADGTFPDYIELHNSSAEDISLRGWYISESEGGYGWALPDITVAAGEYKLIFADGLDFYTESEIHTDFSLSFGETVRLYNPHGLLADSMECITDEYNQAIVLNENGEAVLSLNPSPGYANTREGHLTHLSAQQANGPIIINEVVTANGKHLKQADGDYCDIVEIKNISGAPVDLSEYYLSDDDDDYLQYQLPKISLAPGQMMLIFCSGDTANSTAQYHHSNFSLNAENERLFLSSSTQIIDYMALSGIPANGSYGRLSGESGFFYFASASPGQENSGGARFVAAKPVAAEPDGVFNDVSSVTVELSGPGTIYYTTDCTVPTTASAVYSEPITLDKTGVVRAIAVEEGGLTSEVLTLSYILNENHTLPVLSLVTNDAAKFNSIFANGIKYNEVISSLSLYEPDGSFTMTGGVTMKGWTSLSLPKKSVGIKFGSEYGDGDLEYDVFDNGINQYASLSIRAGQDYTSAIIRTELFQELCAELSDSVLVQESKYCVLYVNGKYYGIYALKEDFSRQYYASHMGVSKDSVTMLRSAVDRNSEVFQEILDFCCTHDMSLDENYEHICSILDIDSLIDFIIMEAYSANSDVNGNMRYFKSTEGDGKWRIAFYDLDWTFLYSGNTFNNTINPDRIVQISPSINHLLKNKEFKMKLAARCVEATSNVLSNENVLAKIDKYQALLEPEIARERERWGKSVDQWHESLDAMRNYVNELDLENYMRKTLFNILGLTQAQRSELIEQYG